MWGQIAAQAIPAVINAAGSLFGGKGEKDGFYEARRQFEENLKFAKDQFYSGVQVRVNDAKAAGIHPLAALGMNPSQGGASGTVGGSYEDQGSNDAYNAFRDAGQGLERAISAYKSPEQRDIERRHAALDLQNKELHNAKLASEIALQRTGSPVGISQGDSPIGELNALLKNLILNKLGHEDGINPIHNLAVDEAGIPIRVFNTNALGDNELAQAFHTLMYTAPDWIHGHVGRPAGKWLRSWFTKD